MRIIDADELQLDYDWSEYDVDGQLVVNGYQAYSESQIENAPTVNAIVIPKDATNGDVMKLIFPNATVAQTSGLHNGFIFAPSIYMTFDNNEDRTYQFGYFWWNEKYFKENEATKPMTREEMIKVVENYCESREYCEMDDGCPLLDLRFCDNTTVFRKWKDEELKQAIDKIKEEENEYGKENH